MCIRDRYLIASIAARVNITGARLGPERRTSCGTRENGSRQTVRNSSRCFGHTATFPICIRTYYSPTAKARAMPEGIRGQCMVDVFVAPVFTPSATRGRAQSSSQPSAARCRQMRAYVLQCPSGAVVPDYERAFPCLLYTSDAADE